MERKAQADLRETIRQLKEKEFKYAPRPEKEIDWRAYNEAQLNDLRFFLTQTRELVDKAAVLLPQKRGVGRPPKQAADVAKAVLLMEYLQVSERAASTWTWVFKEKLAITDELSPRTIGRGFEDEDVRFILETMFAWTAKRFDEVETSVAIDATGVSESIKTNYASVKAEDEAKAASFLKLSISVGTACHGIGAYRLTRGVGDSPLFKPLLTETVGVWPHLFSVEADAGYLARENTQACVAYGLTPYLFPKTGVTLKQKGFPAWKAMLSLLVQNPQAWLAAYHARSNVECGNSCLARRFRPLSCRKDATKFVEELTRLVLHNVRQLNTAICEGKIHPN
jgi:transposase